MVNDIFQKFSLVCRGYKSMETIVHVENQRFWARSWLTFPRGTLNHNVLQTCISTSY